MSLPLAGSTTAYPRCVFIEFSSNDADNYCGSAAISTIDVDAAFVIQCLPMR